jgi:L-lysine exporter family protein LysE/ArgO
MHWSAFVTGLTMSAALIIAIGAQNAFVLRQGLRREHVSAIVVFCVVADLALISLGVAGVAAMLGEAPTLVHVLTIGGSAFLLWYAYRSFRNAFRMRALSGAADGSVAPLQLILVQAAGFTFLNPHVYLDTVLLLGSVGARQPPELRMWFIAGAAAASVAWFSSLGYGARLLAPLFARARAWQILDLLIGATMVVLAVLLARCALSAV